MRARSAVVLLCVAGCGGRSSDVPGTTDAGVRGPDPSPPADAADPFTPVDGSIHDDGRYGARAVIANIDRIVVAKQSFARDLCFRVQLAHVMRQDSFGVATPSGWTVETASVEKAAAGCLEEVPPSNPVFASGGAGQVTFSSNGVPYPCAVGLDLSLFFPPGGFNPQVEKLRAADIPVDGACVSSDAGAD
jgi:hypothetical protein